VAWWPIFWDTSHLFQMHLTTHLSYVNWCYVVQLHLIQLAMDIGIVFQLWQP
jgi:hypothetical protein